MEIPHFTRSFLPGTRSYVSFFQLSRCRRPWPWLPLPSDTLVGRRAGGGESPTSPSTDPPTGWNFPFPPLLNGLSPASWRPLQAPLGSFTADGANGSFFPSVLPPRRRRRAAGLSPPHRSARRGRSRVRFPPPHPPPFTTSAPFPPPADRAQIRLPCRPFLTHLWSVFPHPWGRFPAGGGSTASPLR